MDSIILVIACVLATPHLSFAQILAFDKEVIDNLQSTAFFPEVCRELCTKANTLGLGKPRRCLSI